MLYYANPCGSDEIADAMRAGRIGYIDTPAQGNLRPAGVDWCADNGRFGKGWPGASRWLTWLTGMNPERCGFATAPDVVGDAKATLEESRPFLSVLRGLGYPAALVAQDGLEGLTVPWDEFDVLFIGGSTEWKLGHYARRLVGAANAHGKRVHMGRVNSNKRLRYAASIGCHSADGTYLRFGPRVNLPKLLSWLHELESNPPVAVA